MKTQRYLGIWMDHAVAYLIELDSTPTLTATIASPFTHEVKEITLHNSESLMHNKEQHEENGYYKSLGESILGFDHVLIFGPTEAKTELFNLLKLDHHFDNIEMMVKQADKMTENQMKAFVQEFFFRHLSNTYKVDDREPNIRR